MVASASPVAVAIVSGPDCLTTLNQALEASGLLETLAIKASDASKSPEELRVFVKPDMTFFFRPATVMTDPALVEYLIDWLHDQGYTSVAIGTSADSSGFWLENRDPLVLADLAGYRFETPQGRPYEVLDLSSDIVPVEFPSGSVLRGTGLARAWVEADFRISFGKCKTDEEFFFSGAVHNLLAVLPMRDKQLHYNHRIQPEDACSDLLRTTPLDFAVIDAYVVNQGNAGSRAPDPLYPSTIIASGSAPLADWALAIKMGLDPYSSPLVGNLLRNGALPEQPKIVGDLSPFPGFRTVHPMTADAVRKRNASLEVQRSASAWLQTVDRQLFPFKDAFTDRLNALLASQFASLDQNPAVFAAFLALNYSLAGVVQMVESSKVLLAKDKLHWVTKPLNLNLESYSSGDYEVSKTYMEPIEHLVMQLTPDANGMRWQYMDKSVVFHFSRRLPIPFEEFVRRVDISGSVRMMNDYIGGACVPAFRDKDGRVTHQAERNLYLPQPNYIVFTGGQNIDVSKLEFITYSTTEHKIFWRTIKSENGTGRFDDGIVSFTKVGDQDTLVSVVGRQEFNLPPFWQLLNLDLNPVVKDYLVAHAYQNFFTKTLANFEADFVGLQHRVGRPWLEPGDFAPPPLPSEKLAESFRDIAGRARREIDRLSAKFSLTAPKPTPVLVDEQGFAHFEGAIKMESGAAQPRSAAIQTAATNSFGFVKDLFEAIVLDLKTSTKGPRT